MKRKLTLVIVLMLSLVLMSCKKIDTTNVYSPSDELNYGVYNLPTSLLESSVGINDELLSALFDGLIYKDSEGNIKPQLSESYTVSENKLEYTFKIRRDIYWSNGEKITSKDFVTFFKEFINNAKSIDDLEELKSIYGVADYFNKKENFEKLVAISSDGELFKIRLNYKDDKFIDNLTKNKFKIKKDFTKLSSYKDYYKNLPYSGQYKISSIEESGKLVLEKNPKYYDKGNGEDKINIIAYNDNESALASYETNKINVMKDPPLSYLPNLISRNEISQSPSYSNTFISYNSKEDNVFNNSKLRKDFGEYVKGIMSTEEFKNIIPSNLINDFSSNKGENSSSISRIEPASSLMELKSINIVSLNTEYNKEVLKFISEQGKKDNLIIYYRLLSSEELEQEIKNGKFSVYIGSTDNIGDYNKIYNDVLSRIYRDESLDKKMKEFEGKETKENIVKYVVKENYCIPLYNKDSIIVKKNDIKELNKDFYGNIILSSMVMGEDVSRSTE